jgi:hypothetical protein
MTDATQPLPTMVTVSQAFAQRVPTQRVIDLLARLEPDRTFGDLAGVQPFRLVAFRVLLRDFPERDETSLWLHSYDVEVEVGDVDPTNGSVPTTSPRFAATGA